jgi:hypothetical protein
LLKEDLGIATAEKDTVKLAQLVGAVDTQWNHQTQKVIAKYCGAMSQNNPTEAQNIREGFLLFAHLLGTAE